MTPPEHGQNPEDPRNLEDPQNPEDPRNTQVPQNRETPSTTSEEEKWRAAALDADHAVRSAVDRVRPMAHRAGQWIVALILRLRQWLDPYLERVREWAAPRTQRVREKMEPRVASASHRLRSALADEKGRHSPSRLRSMQVGVAVAAVGVVGVMIGSISTPEDPVDNAAQVTSTPSSHTPEQAKALADDDKKDESKSQSKSGPTEGSSGAARAQAAMSVPSNAEGIDVSNHNGNVDWGQVADSGRKFAFVLATDGESFTSSKFNEQYNGAKDAGLLAGGYHFGRPSGSATGQADRLLQATGGYQADGKTLPPVLDMEVDPKSGGCYSKSSGEMHAWIDEFTDRVQQDTGRDPIIYVSPSFWQNCMGNSDAFSEKPLWLASYGVDDPSVPGGWGDYSFWQYSESGSVDGISGSVDVNKFQGSGDQLKRLAR